jgi:hypothetical protein
MLREGRPREGQCTGCFPFAGECNVPFLAPRFVPNLPTLMPLYQDFAYRRTVHLFTSNPSPYPASPLPCPTRHHSSTLPKHPLFAPILIVNHKKLRITLRLAPPSLALVSFFFPHPLSHSCPEDDQRAWRAPSPLTSRVFASPCLASLQLARSHFVHTHAQPLPNLACPHNHCSILPCPPARSSHCHQPSRLPSLETLLVPHQPSPHREWKGSNHRNLIK